MTTHHVTTTDNDVTEDEPSALELVVGFAREQAPGPVRRDELPAGVQNALDEALTDQPGRRAVVLAFRTLLDGVETTRVGPEAELPPDDELIVVSVVTSEVSTTAVHVVAHTVVAHVVAD
jgi:hypothetical protein